jgi:hypothetical protein
MEASDVDGRGGARLQQLLAVILGSLSLLKKTVPEDPRIRC